MASVTSVHPTWTWTQPDISYYPDRDKWLKRTAQRLGDDPTLLSTPLPEGFPRKVYSTLAWEGKDWKDESQWVYNLNVAQLKEIDDAVNHFNALGVAFGHISPITFPLPTLGPILMDMAKEVYRGRGFFVLRTIPVDSYNRADNVLIYAGVSSYIGKLRGLQDKNGGVLAHIKDLSRVFPPGAIGSPAHTTDKQVYHTDFGTDIVSLYALEIAAEGGMSRISSSWRVYNELAETRPDLVKILSEPWPVERFNVDPPFTTRPLLYDFDSRIIVQFARRYFTGYKSLPRSKDIPPITEAQAEAIDSLQFLGEKYSLGLNFQKGDIQYINNLSVLHARDGFKDDEKHARHLLRLWMRNEDLAWKLPKPLQPLWQEIFDVTPEQQTFALEPVIRNAAKGKS